MRHLFNHALATAQQIAPGFTSASVNMSRAEQFSLQCKWFSGVNMGGTIKIQASNDEQTWIDVSGLTLTVASDSGTGFIVSTTYPYVFLRALYVNTTTGVQTISCSADLGDEEESEITCIADAGEREETEIICIADAGEREVTDIVCVAASSLIAGTDYFTIDAPNSGTHYYVWWTIDGAGTDPAPGGTGLRVDLVGTDDAATVANKTATVLGGVGVWSVPAPVGAVITATATKVGACVPPTESVADAGFLIVVTTTGVASNLNNKYFTISSINATSKAQKDFYVWYNVDGLGSDPAISGKTGVQVNIAYGAQTDIAVAAATASALNALTSDFSAAATLEVVTATNVRVGSVTNAADTGSTGFTISTPTNGVNSNLNNKYFTISSINATSKARKDFYVWYSVDGLGTNPAISGKTGVQVNITYGAQANTDVASATATALAALTNDFASASAVGAVVTVVNDKVGAVPDVADGPSGSATGFTFVTTNQGVNSNLNNKYFYINAYNLGTAYYVWYNVDGLGTDPAISGKTGVQVNITAGAQAANDVADATAAAINALAAFIAPNPPAAVVTVTNAGAGPFIPASDVNTGFTFAVTTGAGLLSLVLATKGEGSNIA